MTSPMPHSPSQDRTSSFLTPNAVFLHRREPNQGDWVQVGNSLTFLAVNLQRPKLSVQPTVLRKPEQMSAEPGGIIPLQLWMGRKADMKAFSTDTYNFHAQQCSTYWDPHATGEQLEQTVVLGKWDITALTALFAFAVLLNPSPAGHFFFLPCMPERAERAASAFCSFSSSSLSQCEPGENITASHWIKNWWDRPQNAAYSGAGTKPAVHRVKSQEPPTAWLSLTSAHLTTAPKPKCHPTPKP